MDFENDVGVVSLWECVPILGNLEEGVLCGPGLKY
jgi:hypothetical protein